MEEENLEHTSVTVQNVSVREFENKLRAIISDALKPLKEELSIFLEKKVYSTAEAAKLLDLTARTINRHCKDGRIKASKRGHSYRIKHQDLMNFIQVQND